MFGGLLFVIIAFIYVLVVSIQELNFEIKHKKLFKKEKQRGPLTRAESEAGLTIADRTPEWGWGTWFLIILACVICCLVLIAIQGGE